MAFVRALYLMSSNHYESEYISRLISKGFYLKPFKTPNVPHGAFSQPSLTSLHACSTGANVVSTVSYGNVLACWGKELLLPSPKVRSPCCHEPIQTCTRDIASASPRWLPMGDWVQKGV